MDLEHEHRRRAWLATLCALLVVAAFLAAKAARDAILLAQFSVTKLPLFVGLSAVLALPVIIVAGKLMSRHGPHRLVPVMNAVSALIAVGEWLIIRDFPRFTAVLVFFHLNTASAVLVSGFWSIINERFDVTTAKRHIGRIGMGATFGGILGGVVAERTGAYFTPDVILLVIAVMQGGCAVLLWWLGRGATTKAVPPPAESSNWSALASVAKSHLLRKAGLVVVITAVGAGALDYVFKADIVLGGSKADLLRALAVFYTVTNIITAIVQIVLTGPAISALGVPRTVATLPATLTGFSLVALLMRIPMVATVARGAELVTRNSVYRAGYELLYAPLPPEQKRPTKVVLDVGADKLGDIVAAQLVGATIWIAADDRTGLLILAIVAGVVSLIVSFGIPRSYTQSLEEGLLEKANELPDAPEGTSREPWVSMAAMPAFGHPGESVPLRVRRRRRAVPAPIVSTDTVVEMIRELRSKDPKRIAAVLGRALPDEAIAAAIDLVGSQDDTIALAATTALRAVAPRCTGTLIDILLDPKRPERLRRRMPAILVSGNPDLAIWGLWRGLRDSSFEVRYRSSIGLSVLAGDGPLASVTAEEVFENVRHELLVDRDEWKARKLEVDAVIDSGDAELDVGLAHVFRVLGLVLPAEPLRVALRAAKTDDPELRGMALEYLESILPPDVRAQVWPLIDGSAEPTMPPAPPSEERQKDLLERLRTTHPALFARKAG